MISTGASAALRKKSDSLLPDGVIDVIGEFEPGDVVELRDTVGCVLGRGLVNYRSSDCKLLAGRSTDDIGSILGWRGCVSASYSHHDTAVKTVLSCGLVLQIR